MVAGLNAPVDDGIVLDILDRSERLGQSMAEVGCVHGLSRSAVGGILKRVRDGLASADAIPYPPEQTAAIKPENNDGGMPARWWQAGLDVRAAKAVR